MQRGRILRGLPRRKRSRASLDLGQGGRPKPRSARPRLHARPPAWGPEQGGVRRAALAKAASSIALQHVLHGLGGGQNNAGGIPSHKVRNA
jgi:hypothetical protein